MQKHFPKKETRSTVLIIRFRHHFGELVKFLQQLPVFMDNALHNNQPSKYHINNNHRRAQSYSCIGYTKEFQRIFCRC